MQHSDSCSPESAVHKLSYFHIPAPIASNRINAMNERAKSISHIHHHRAKITYKAPFLQLNAITSHISNTNRFQFTHFSVKELHNALVHFSIRLESLLNSQHRRDTQHRLENPPPLLKMETHIYIFRTYDGIFPLSDSHQTNLYPLESIADRKVILS